MTIARRTLFGFAAACVAVLVGPKPKHFVRIIGHDGKGNHIGARLPAHNAAAFIARHHEFKFTRLS